MTQDALDEAARIKALIALLNKELTDATNKINSDYPSLTTDQRATLRASIHSLYQGHIDTQTTALADLKGDYVKS